MDASMHKGSLKDKRICVVRRQHFHNEYGSAKPMGYDLLTLEEADLCNDPKIFVPLFRVEAWTPKCGVEDICATS